MNKREFLEKVIVGVGEIPLNNIIELEMTLQRKGSSYYGICPFHNDNKMGSFVVTPGKHIYKCFSCGEGGDGISFYGKMKGLSYVESAFELAIKFNVISQFEYDEYWKNKKYTKKEVKKLERKIKEIEKVDNTPEVAEPEILDKVYNLFLDLCSISDAHIDYFKDTRKFSMEDIEDGKYKTVPNGYILKKFKTVLKEEFGTLDILTNIPGFFMEDKKIKQGDGSNLIIKVWSFVKYKGIFIPIRNANNQIIGLQIRRDEKTEGFSRYVWFSSAFAIGKDGKYLGTTSGSPIDVVYPKVIKNTTVFITEGRFKAKVLAEKFNSIVISVQGVSSWSGIKETLQDISNSKCLEALTKGKTYEVSNIFLAFDADMNYKPQVWQQAKKMTDYLKENNYNITYLNWNEELGKGIDDLILAGHIASIKKYEKCEWDSHYELILETIFKETDFKKVQDIPTDVFKSYFDNIMTIEPLKKGEVSVNRVDLTKKKAV